MASAPLTISQAREVVQSAVRTLGDETVAIDDALGRVLTAEVRAASDVPPFACSAMDGYALRAGPAGRKLAVVGEARAGSPSERAVGEGEAIRISTGAAVPPGSDSVIRQEDVERRGTAVITGAETAPGTNIRGAGDDLRAGSAVLEPGVMLGAAELGAAVSAGASSLTVTRRPRVVVLCTGDELRPPGEPLGPGEIHNSNGPMLRALAQRAAGLGRGYAIVPDAAEATREGLASALDQADVVIVCGGVSVGPHDHVKPALASLGVRELFWGVSLQPGRPTWFGERDGKLVFGLPGNPVSAVVTFTLFVRPALLAMQGLRLLRRLEAAGRLAVPVARNPRREQALRVRLERRDGQVLITPNGPQGSHLISSLLGADALALIPPGKGELPAGAEVGLEELPGYGIITAG
jgi:molybdopterin molybdotransferase